MKKTVLVYLFTLFSFLCFPQKVIHDTIEISTGYITYLTLGGFVQEIDYGSRKDIEQNSGQPMVVDVKGNTLVKLKARRKFKETNLFAFNSDGITYDLIVKYASKPKKRAYFIGKIVDDSPRKIIPIKDTLKIKMPAVDPADKYKVKKTDEIIAKQEAIIEKERLTFDTIPYEKTAKILYSSRAFGRIKGIGVKQQGVVLTLENSWVGGDKLYFKFVVVNTKSKAFVIKNWQFKISPSGALRRKNATEQRVKPIYEYKKEHQIAYAHKKLIKMFVFDNFGIADNEQFKVQVLQAGSNNTPTLFLPSKYVNKPRNAGKGVFKTKKPKEKTKK